MAPMELVASKAITVSGMLGIRPAIRSPFTIPRPTGRSSSARAAPGARAHLKNVSAAPVSSSGRAATTHLGASGRFASASATCVQINQCTRLMDGIFDFRTGRRTDDVQRTSRSASGWPPPRRAPVVPSNESCASGAIHSSCDRAKSSTLRAVACTKTRS